LLLKLCSFSTLIWYPTIFNCLHYFTISDIHQKPFSSLSLSLFLPSFSLTMCGCDIWLSNLSVWVRKKRRGVYKYVHCKSYSWKERGGGENERERKQNSLYIQSRVCANKCGCEDKVLYNYTTPPFALRIKAIRSL